MKKFFLSIHPLSLNFAVLLLRLVSGGAMLTHGYPKLQKVLSGNFQFGDPLGIGSEASLILVVFAEFLCSILVMIGLLTRFALIPLIINMSVIFFIVHAADDFKTKELAFLFLGIFITLFFTGPGTASMDKLLK